MHLHASVERKDSKFSGIKYSSLVYVHASVERKGSKFSCISIHFLSNCMRLLNAKIVNSVYK